MWWKLGALALLAAGLVALLAAPVTTVDITVEMPASKGPPPSANDVEAIFTLVALMANALIGAAFALIGWLMWRVVRHHRGSKGHS